MLSKTLLLLLLPLGVLGQEATPESQGVSSAALVQFLDSAATHKNEFHSFLLLRHGKTVAEGYWNPYHAGLLQTLYSVSKSFTSTAVGFAVSEGRLKVSDKVLSFFPDLAPTEVPEHLRDMTVRDLLTMLCGQDPEPSAIPAMSDTSWVRAFLKVPVPFAPGTHFVYNSIGVYVLSAIVQRVTGQKMLDYLKPRLFQPLGITQADWEESPAGENTGGWGLRLTTVALAKVGQLYLQQGVWNGRQILPKAWVAEATNAHTDQGPGWAAHSVRDSSDWLQGYGYLFWRCRHECYRADGAFGQYIIVMPDEDAVLAITCETRDLQDELNLVWRFVLPAFHDGALPADAGALASLRSRSAALSLAPPTGGSGDHTARSLHLNPNSYGYKEMDLSWTGDDGHLTLKTAEAGFDFELGLGKWVTGKTFMKGPYLVSRAAGAMAGLAPFQVACAYAWKDASTLVIQLRYIESPHTETITCHFDAQGMKASVHNSFEDAPADHFLSTSNP